MAPIQYTTGYFLREADEGCNETGPNCPACEESRAECPGYTDSEITNKSNEKSQAHPTTRLLVDQTRATLDQRPSVNTEELQYSIEGFEIYNIPSPSEIASVGTSSTATDASNQWPSSASSGESVEGSPIDLDTSHLLVGFTDPTPTPLPLDLNIQCLQTRAASSVPLVSNWSAYNIEQQHDDQVHGDQDVGGVVNGIHRGLVLDRMAESNALPFVIQGYFAWISRLALDPLKMAGITRDFVFDQFEGGEQSRWTIALLANVGSRIGSAEFIEGRPNRMLSMLQNSVQRRLTTILQFYASPVSEAMTLIQEAAPIFRQLCPGPPNAAVALRSLLKHPLGCLWHYAYVDIIFSVIMDMPTLCRYDLAIPNSQPLHYYGSIPASKDEGIIQWQHGVPNQLVFIFAHMRSMRGDGIIPNEETVMSLERGIREIPVFDGSSSERFLGIIRSVVQECWKQAALVYLYMAVCGDPSDKPRVKEAFKRYMKLFTRTQPGRLPDEFLILTLQLVCPAAQRPRDRAVIKQRALGLYTRDRTHIATTFITLVMDDVWVRADDEGRPIMWSDIAVSRRKLLGA